ncbi:hypothetical protein [Paenibacillus medicaginis]|uniref:Uncharacterized protein n=1 Tax=Paenibacillus medicaginis TaxID=1470560 RepID=A0ABV5BVG8_9BACL
METMENSLNLHFENNPANQQRLIVFLKQSYSEDELYALGRILSIEKDDYVGRGMTKQQLSGSLVEMIVQRSLIERLFVILESPAYVRPRLYQVFRDLGFKEPFSEDKLREMTEGCFEENKSNSAEKSFSEWLEKCKKSMVLVLGKDNTHETWTRLKMICEQLKMMGYSPFLIKDQPDIGHLTNEEKMLAYAAIARFIVIEKSVPSGHIDEAHICAINRLVGIWLREEGMGDTWMQGDYEVSYHHIKGFTYNKDNLGSIIENGVTWAEEYLKGKEQQLNRIYPFRR